MKIEVYSDGSATVSSKPGGWGYVVVVDGQFHSEGSGYVEAATNNDMELEAAIQGLSAAVKIAFEPIQILGKFDPVELIPPSITLISDSKLILGWASGEYAFKQAAKFERYRKLRDIVKQFYVVTKWVKGHSGDPNNERCDRLANQARTGIEKKKKAEIALLNGDTRIGDKKEGIVCLWFQDKLKVLDLTNNIIEDYSRDKHGKRGSSLEIREDKLR